MKSAVLDNKEGRPGYMFDLSSMFNTFYRDHVVLPQEKLNELYDKKDLNVQRLKDGLKEYNEEHGASLSIAEAYIQGSVAMSTVVQNENNDYDIDVAIVFDRDALGDRGARATRNMVADALKRKTKQFNAEPEVKTSCVRVRYADGYHIDFAVYRRSWDPQLECWKYEHAGSDWAERELRKLNDWFKKQNEASDGKLRKAVRLSKMFCKSRDFWKSMPSGLIQTVLCDERLESQYTRIDELFYYTMKSIVDRLEASVTVAAPVDNGRDLTPRQSDLNKMISWKNRLNSKLGDLEVLFKDDCSRDDALQAWYGFFNHDYWNEKDSTKQGSCTPIEKPTALAFDDTEEFIEDSYPVLVQHTVKLDCIASADGFRSKPLSCYSFVLQKFIPHNFKIRCSIASTTVQAPYEVFWKVKNVGPVAQRRNCIRGQIKERGRSITENTLFYGNHYIECYIVKGGVCVAKEHVDVPIGRS